MGIIWTIIIGFLAGVIAKFIMPGPNEPQGFILTAILGIVGAFVASFLGQMLGWYGPGEGAGLIGAVVGAIIVLFVYEGTLLAESGLTCDPSANPTSQYSSEESAEPGNGFWMPPNLTGIIYAILCARSWLNHLLRIFY